jgi:hypothetical protein
MPAPERLSIFSQTRLPVGSHCRRMSALKTGIS